MKNSRMLVLVVVFASCTPKGVGEFCSAAGECAEGQECVIVDGKDTFCLPRPSRRQPSSCVTLTGCTDDIDTVWPSNVACLDGSCRCPTTAGSCVGGRNLVFEEETCSCVPRGGQGAACITSFTCKEGLACDATTKQCEDADASGGAACRTDRDCSSGDCERRTPLAALGVCKPP